MARRGNKRNGGNRKKPLSQKAVPEQVETNRRDFPTAAQFDATYIREPELIFGGHHRSVDPKTGLGLYGPFDVNMQSRPDRVRLGIIGTGAMVDMARRWIERSRSKITPIRRIRRRGITSQLPMDPTVVPPFPGNERVFGSQFVLVDSMIEVITDRELVELKTIPLFEDRVTFLVKLLAAKLQVMKDKPGSPNVVICALPTDVRKSCTIPSMHARRGKRMKTQIELLREEMAAEEQRGELGLFADLPTALGVDLPVVDSTQEEPHAGLHHALKARAMEVGIPTQLVWQGTLEGVNVEDEATRAWNFWTGIYYKANGEPWRLGELEAGTCFVGIAFYRDKFQTEYRTCVAQAFSTKGDAIVLRSQRFKWESLSSPHLSAQLAEELMALVLITYRDHLTQPPSRVVVHKWQRYTQEERDGFEKAISKFCATYDLVAFGSRGIRFFRQGQQPPLRGTMISLSQDNALLYTRGYVHYLRQYPGMRIPRPLEIVEHFGSAPLTQICEEILALTKMDWNSSAFSGKAPITTAFATDVGHILAEVPEGGVVQTSYRFYM